MSKSEHEMIDGDKPESAEAPKDEGMSQANEWAIANHLGLQDNVDDKFSDAPGNRSKRKMRIRFGREDAPHDFPQARDKHPNRDPCPEPECETAPP